MGLHVSQKIHFLEYDATTGCWTAAMQSFAFQTIQPILHIYLFAPFIYFLNG
jgi:hypothetical protein